MDDNKLSSVWPETKELKGSITHPNFIYVEYYLKVRIYLFLFRPDRVRESFTSNQFSGENF